MCQFKILLHNDILCDIDLEKCLNFDTYLY